ncbi:transglycosylase SLT domain-containing protein [Xylophilus rhododendri]|uniref:Transglycosylase SLT domain-containing protein n=1 Tax=Xylophilus rhododendri TaxID=2697032 RepID=A0A857J776_9BURK|nr:lytic transglycosylase domain-containing protein [Xylophilus rhododendri]QHI99557.1 transglycosylase SLT domain-containing protein [Xylophilus rhododendri]
MTIPWKILTSAALVLSAVCPAFAQPLSPRSGDDAVLDMSQAFRRGDRNRLAALLPLVRGHALEPWAAYWELKVRLQDAAPEEVDAFLARWSGTYQEDRLRNDWLLLLGQRRDWQRFAQQYPAFRMNDDREVRCHALLVGQLGGLPAPTGGAADAPAEVLRNWYAQREADDGCANAVASFFAAGRIEPAAIWRKARLAIEANRPRLARNAVDIVAPDASAQVAELSDNPARFLAARAVANSKVRKELVTLALLRMAQSDADAAALQLDGKWSVQISAEERNYLWGAIGRQAATKLSPLASDYFGRATKDADLSGDMLGWKVRAALRAGRWRDVVSATGAMDEATRADPAWVYWRARALVAIRPSENQRAEAQQLLESIASPRGFYEQLAMEELGRPIVLPPRPAPLTPEERDAARNNGSLARGLYAILLGLRSEGVREWNYATNLHNSGGMSERELLAAADMACQSEVWDRCINTSERTRVAFDATQRFPMPHEKLVVQHSRRVGIDPAYVYGLIRQESRFVTDARSGVGASGLMQVMPATARWTARKIGLSGFTPDQLADRDTNITIGTAYLKLALDDFQGSMPLAAAAYNAGPGRPRAWREGPVLEAAIWAENVPFAETRDYVKKVLANTVSYAALLSGQPQSLKTRLGNVGPKDPNFVEPSKDLP